MNDMPEGDEPSFLALLRLLLTDSNVQVTVFVAASIVKKTRNGLERSADTCAVAHGALPPVIIPRKAIQALINEGFFHKSGVQVWLEPAAPGVNLDAVNRDN